MIKKLLLVILALCGTSLCGQSVVVGTTPPPCNSGHYWQAPVGGSTNAMVVCDNGTLNEAGTVIGYTYAPTNVIGYGDSVMRGGGVTPYPQDVMVYRLATMLGLYASTAPDNLAVDGSMAGDVANTQVFPNEAPAISAGQPLQVGMWGTNEAFFKGAGAYEATYNTISQAIISWLTVPSVSKVMGSTVVGSATGTCAEDTTYASALGVVCTASASTAPFSITTTGGPIYIWYRTIDGDGGTWTYSVDSATPVSVSTALTTAVSTHSGDTQAVAFIRIPVSAGTHTVNFVQTNSGTMSILGVGTPPPSTVFVATLPYMVVEDIINEDNGGNQTSVNAYRADITADVALLAGDGLQVFLAKVSQYVPMTTAAGDIQGNQLHPNAAGNLEMAEAVMAAIKLIPNFQNVVAAVSATTQSLTLNTALSSSTLPSPATTTMDYVNGGSLTLPTMTNGQTITIVNYAKTPATFSAGFEGTNTIPPLGAVTINDENGTLFVTDSNYFHPSVAAIEATGALGIVPVKLDTSNANQIVETTTGDTGPGIVVGVCDSTYTGAEGMYPVATSGVIPLKLGTGTCAIGQFVIVDTTTNGDVQCTSTYTAGTIIGTAMATNSTVGTTFNVLVGIK